MHHASSCYHSVQAYLNYLIGFIIITTGPGGGGGGGVHVH